MTHYEVIMGQVTLKDWTVVKVMLSAVIAVFLLTLKLAGALCDKAYIEIRVGG